MRYALAVFLLVIVYSFLVGLVYNGQNGNPVLECYFNLGINDSN